MVLEDFMYVVTKNFNANGIVVTIWTLLAHINFNGTKIPITPSGKNVIIFNST